MKVVRFIFCFLAILVSNCIAEGIKPLEFPAYGSYNGFLSHVNTLECINLEETRTSLTLEILDNSSSVINRNTFNIRAGSTINYDLTQIENKYGLFRLTTNDSDAKISCINTVKKITENNIINDTVDYSIVFPIGQKLSGTTSGLYNSMDITTQGIASPNWLSISNINNQNFSGIVATFDYNGKHLEDIDFNLNPYSQIDVALAALNGETVGMYKIIPSSALDYSAYLTRYNNFNDVSILLPKKNSCNSELTVATLANATNWLELGNNSEKFTSINIQIKSNDKELLSEQNLILAPNAQRHIYMNDIIGKQSIGSVELACYSNLGTSILAQSMFYGKDSKDNYKWSYGSQHSDNKDFNNSALYVGFVNTEHNTANWLRSRNLKDYKMSKTIKNYTNTGIIFDQKYFEMTALSNIHAPLHEYFNANSYGKIRVEQEDVQDVFSGEVLRVHYDNNKEVSEITNTPLVFSTQRVVAVEPKDLEPSNSNSDINDTTAVTLFSTTNPSNDLVTRPVIQVTALDIDGDGIENDIDKCRDFYNPSQENLKCHNESLEPEISSLSTETGNIYFGYDANNIRNGGLTLYVISNGNTWVNSSFLNNKHNLIYQVKDPEENIIYWENNLDNNSTFTTNIENSVPNIVHLNKTGVYQFIIYADEHGLTEENAVNFEMSPNTEYGVSFHHGSIAIGDYGNGKVSWENKPSTVYAWAPVNRTANMVLKLRSFNRAFREEAPFPFVLQDETSGITHTEGNIVIPASQTLEGHVIRIREQSAEPWRIWQEGFPLVLSTSREAATRIHASVERIESGPYSGMLVSHKSQKELAELMSDLSNKVNSARYDNLKNVDFQAVLQEESACTDLSLEEFAKSRFLFGVYEGTITSALWSTTERTQNTDPSSKWFGALGLFNIEDSQLRCSIDSDCSTGDTCGAEGFCNQSFNESTHTWDLLRNFSYSSESNTYGRIGASMYSTKASAMAWSALNYHPCNPLGPESDNGNIRYPELFNRAALASMLNSLAFKEDFTTIKSTLNRSLYSGSADFQRDQTIARSYADISPYLRDVLVQNNLGVKFQTLWAKIMRGAYDKAYYEQTVSARNQTAHRLNFLRSVFEGFKGLPIAESYNQNTRIWAKRFVDGFHAAGFAQESAAIDASYNGITHHALAEYVAKTKSDSIGEDFYVKSALEKSYDFFSHTLAIEPNGKVVGSNNFSHRTGLSSNQEQFNGAKYILQEIPLVGLLTPKLPSTTNTTTLPNGVRRGIEILGDFYLRHGNSSIRYEHYQPNFESNFTLPSQQADSYIRTFGDADDIQLLAVKTQKYFTNIYLGQPAPSEFYVSSRSRHYFIENNNVNLAEGIEPSTDNANIIGNHGPLVDNEDSRSIIPLLSGGLSMISDNNFGTSLLAKNWSPKTHHGVIAELNDKRTWSNYFERDFNLNESNNELTVSGELYNLESDTSNAKIEYIRNYKFDENKIIVTLSLKSDKNITLTKLYENIPVATCSTIECNGNLSTFDSSNVKDNGSTIYLNDNKIIGDFDQRSNNVKLLSNSATGISIDTEDNTRITGNTHGMRSHTDQVGWVEINLPTNLVAGEFVHKTYTINFL